MRFPYILAAVACLVSTASHAAILTYDFTGVIAESQRYHISLDLMTRTEDGTFSDFSPGQAFSGSIAFETVATSPNVISPTLALYRQKSSIQLNVQRSFGEFQVATTGLCDNNQLVGDNVVAGPGSAPIFQNTNVDVVVISQPAEASGCLTIRSPASIGYSLATVEFVTADILPLGGNLPALLSTVDFVADIGSLWGVSPLFQFGLFFDGPQADDRFNYASASGKLTSFTARVPEPMSAPLMAFGCAGLLWRRQRAKRLEKTGAAEKD